MLPLPVRIYRKRSNSAVFTLDLLTVRDSCPVTGIPAMSSRALGASQVRGTMNPCSSSRAAHGAIVQCRQPQRAGKRLSGRTMVCLYDLHIAMQDNL